MQPLENARQEVGNLAAGAGDNDLLPVPHIPQPPP